MANIALVTYSTANAGHGRAKTAIDALGHTTTEILEADALTTDFSGYDLIFTTALSLGTLDYGHEIFGYLLATGKPLITGAEYNSAFTTTGDKNILPIRVGIVGPIDGTSTVANVIPTVAHDITTGLTVGTSYAFWTSSQSAWARYYPTVLAGAEVAHGTGGNTSGDAVIVALEAGTDTQSGYFCQNRVVVFPTYFPTTLAATGVTLLDQSIDWALAGVAVAADELVVSKAIPYAVLIPGAADNSALAVSKLAVYAVMEPGSEEPPPASGSRRRVQNINYY